jgi:diguanylate cyclase (GGDEF)-like protein
VPTAVVIRQPTASHFRQLRALALEASTAPDLSAAIAVAADGLSRLLDTRVRIAPIAPTDTAAPRRPPPVPWLPATGGGVVATPQPGTEATTTTEPQAVVIGSATARVALGLHGGTEWEAVLDGTWESPRQRLFLAELGRTLGAALQAPALRTEAARANAVVAAAYAFARRLGRIHAPESLHQFIVDTMAQATRARLGSLAVWAEAEGALRIAATHGYPSVLVEHVRVAPGAGVLGRVFETRRPLLVRDVAELEGMRGRRPRYRTASFLALPLVTNSEVLGVATFADREDDRPFETADLTAARTLAAPAALALLNDRLADQTRQLAHAATIDPLTGLYNRRYFFTRIEEEIERARRYGLDLALLLADIDDFKQINDSLGHLAGDYLLRQIAEVLKRSVRVFDVCTRFGGEEFAILMPGSGPGNAMIVAERIRSRVEAASREEGPLPPHLRITISLGLTVLAADASAQELIARADRALYRAKAAGKNCVRME